MSGSALLILAVTSDATAQAMAPATAAAAATSRSLSTDSPPSSADTVRRGRAGPWKERPTMAQAVARRVRDVRLDLTPAPRRRLRWHAPAWMRDAVLIVAGTALLWALYVAMWAVVGR